jgi:hypothetical protein
MAVTKDNLRWLDGLYTEETLTDDTKEDLISNTEAIVSEHRELLKKLVYALNNIPNHKDVGMDGESSYDLASMVDKFLEETEYEFQYDPYGDDEEE